MQARISRSRLYHNGGKCQSVDDACLVEWQRGGFPRRRRPSATLFSGGKGRWKLFDVFCLGTANYMTVKMDKDLSTSAASYSVSSPHE